MKNQKADRNARWLFLTALLGLAAAASSQDAPSIPAPPVAPAASDIRNSLDAGYTAHLTKPVNIGVLMTKVREIGEK